MIYRFEDPIIKHHTFSFFEVTSMVFERIDDGTEPYTVSSEQPPKSIARVPLPKVHIISKDEIETLSESVRLKFSFPWFIEFSDRRFEIESCVSEMTRNFGLKPREPKPGDWMLVKVPDEEMGITSFEYSLVITELTVKYNR